MKQQKTAPWRRLWQRIHPRMPDYFGMAIEQCDSLIKSLDALEGYLGENRAQQAERIRDLVHGGHALAQRNLDALHRSFVTPIDREDIYAIITGIDHVFDYVTTSVREIELLEVPGDRWMMEMVSQLQQGAAALKQGFELFRKDPAAGGGEGEAARRAERNVEEIYRQALQDMFGGRAVEAMRHREQEVTPVDCLDYVFSQMKRREVYRHLSNGADRLAHVGELLHDLGVKYD